MDKHDCPRNATLYGLLTEAVEGCPSAEAVVYDTGVHIQRLTYRELGQQCHRVCEWLRHAGISKEIVAIAHLQGVHLPSVITGIMKVPAAFLPLDTHGGRNTMRRTLEQLGVRLICTDPSKTEEVQNMMSHPTRIDHIEEVNLAVVWISDTRCQWQSEVDLAYIITTSGSTGDPKVVRVSHQCIVPNVTHIKRLYRMSPRDTSILMPPLTFDPSIVEIYVALTSGSRLILVPDVVKMVPSLLVETIDRHQVTVMHATPSIMGSLGLKLLQSHVLPDSGSLRILSLGGEPCPSHATLQSWRSPGNTTTVINLYGITEVSSWALYHVVTDDESSSLSDVPLGCPLQNTDYEVRDHTGQRVETGEGQLFVGSPLRLCLLTNEEKPPVDGMRATGDRVMIDSQGRIWYRGRIDRQVKRHGMRLNLDSLELVAMELDKVCRCAAFLCDQSGKLHLVLQPVQTEGTEGQQESAWCYRVDQELDADMRKHLHQNLPQQYTPDHIWAMDTLPYTRHGKVDREYLRKMIIKVKKQGSEKSLHQIQQHQIEKLWKECLNLPTDYVPAGTDTFLTSGGDSFCAVRFLNLLSGEHNHKYDPLLLEVLLTKTYSDVLSLVKKYTEKHADKENPSETMTKELNISTNPGEIITDTVVSTEVQQGQKRQWMDNAPDQLGTKRHKLDSEIVIGSTVSCVPVKQCKVVLSRTNRTINLCQYNTSTCLKCKEILRVKEEGSLLSVSPPAVQLKIEWSYDTGKCIDASPLVLMERSAGVVFIGSHSHKFVAVSVVTGSVLWEQILPDRIESSACVSPDGESVVVGCYDGSVYVMDIHTGHILWTFVTRGQVKSSPCCNLKTSLVYIGSHDHHIYALNLKEKRCSWERHLEAGSVYSSPATCCCHLQVYVGTLGGVLCALQSETGELLWRRNLGKPIFSSPCVTPTTVVIGCVDNQVTSFSHTGTKMWTFNTLGPVFSSPCWITHSDSQGNTYGHYKNCVSRGRILIGCHGKAVHCLDEQGNQVWSFITESEVFSSPCVVPLFPPTIESENVCNLTKMNNIGSSSDSTATNNEQLADSWDRYVVIVCTTKGRVCVLKMADGHLLGQITMDGEVFSSPVVHRDYVYIGCRDNRLYCLKLLTSSNHLKT